MNMSCLWMKLAGLRSRPMANPSKDSRRLIVRQQRLGPASATRCVWASLC